jgi:hypothetical protein
MASVWATVVQGCVGGLLDGLRRALDEAPCPGRTRPATDDTSSAATDGADLAPSSDAPPATETTAPEPPQLVHTALTPPAAGATATLVGRQSGAGDGEGELPPAPWRWRWVWATPGRPAGMALVAADGSLVLWSPGGFAPAGAPPDGRPTAEVAAALTELPELSRAAADAESLRDELRRTRAVADETKRLLNRAVGAVDDEIGSVNRPGGGPGRPAPGAA